MDHLQPFCPFFSIIHNEDTYLFGNCLGDEPRHMENRFEYTYIQSTSPEVSFHVSLAENTIGAALQSMFGDIDRPNVRFHWNVPMHVQERIAREGWTYDRVMNTEIGDHHSLRIYIQ